MAQRLTALDAALLHQEAPGAPLHAGAVVLLDPPASGAVDYDALVDLLAVRLGRLPRYRQVVRDVPGRLANPVWVDDTAFDLTYHVRRSALPRPGSLAQLQELVARVQARPLDRSRPLWELYVVEGLAGGGCALVTKVHHALTSDSPDADLSTVLLDPQPPDPSGAAADDAGPGSAPAWLPDAAPGAVRLVGGAVVDLLRSPWDAVDSARGAAADVRATGSRLLRGSAGLLAATGVLGRPRQPSPFVGRGGEARGFATAATDLDDYRRVRKAHGVAINDVVLAAVAGAVRGWLLNRAETLNTAASVRVLLPVGVSEPTGTPRAATLGSVLVDLPIGEPSPGVRLHQISYATRAHRESARALGAQALIELSGYAPALHAAASRFAATVTGRLAQLVVSNVPGPQQPLWCADGRVGALYPVVPVPRGQALTVGVTSYDGGVYFGVLADRDAVPDVEVFAALLPESLTALVESLP